MIFQNEKRPFKAVKTRSSKSRKIDIFSKRLTHGFGPKRPFFQLFFLPNIGQENVFDDILERKNAFLGYKNDKFKKSKNWHFFKEVNPWFWFKKRPFFQLSFLGSIGQENVSDDILERKNAFLGYKNDKFKKSKNWHFSKRVTQWFWSKNDHFSSFVVFREYRLGKCLLWYSRTKKRLARL